MNTMPTLISADYDQARAAVQDGDLIALRSTKSMLAKVTRVLLDTPYTHAGLALWLDGGLWVSEMWGAGNVMVPLSQYKDEDFDVFACPVDRVAVREQILVHMRDEIQYDTWDLLRIVGHENFNIPLPERDDERLTCSGFAAHVYLAVGGWAQRKPLPSIAAPSHVVDAVGGPPVLRYRPYRMHSAAGRG